MYNIDEIKNTIINGDALEELKRFPSESVDMCITSPPYWSLRDYGVEEQLGNESTYDEYIENLMKIFRELKRVLKKKGSFWLNIGDVYSGDNKNLAKKQSMIGLPDRIKIKMIDEGWLCRNEIIWHKPNAMPSSAKTRFNNDYEKFYFFTKDDLYYFETQYEEAKTKKVEKKTVSSKESKSKYIDDKQEASVRQGMNKSRGTKIIEVRKELPTQKDFIEFLRERISIKTICENVDIKKTKVEHWFRKDEKGFAFPSVEDWNKVKYLLDDGSEDFKEIDYKLTHVEYETDDINKNLNKGRIKRSVWSINTKAFKGCHFAPFPEELIETPIKSCCPEDGIVLDIFMGSGTSGLVAKKLNRNYIGIELNEEYVELSKKRIAEEI